MLADHSSTTPPSQLMASSSNRLGSSEDDGVGSDVGVGDAVAAGGLSVGWTDEVGLGDRGSELDGLATG